LIPERERTTYARNEQTIQAELLKAAAMRGETAGETLSLSGNLETAAEAETSRLRPRSHVSRTNNRLVERDLIKPIVNPQAFIFSART
jgi:hypothetical protein